MEIQVTCRSKERKEFIAKCAKFFAKTLNLKKSRFVVKIHSVHNLLKNNGSNGETCKTDDRQIHVLLDSRLPVSLLLLTLAHEMVHVKQIARGQYSGKVAKNGRMLSCWCGVPVRAEYLKRPWEIEAYARQMDLVDTLFKHVAKQAKKKG